MMRRVITIITAAVILCSAAAGEARAAGFQLGVTFWYAWWEPMFKNWLTQGFYSGAPLQRLVHNYSFAPAPLMGPVLGIDFNDRVNLTAIFVTGKYRFRSSMLEYGPIGSGLFVPSHQDVGIDKYDLDTALNISINRYVKILVGFKYQNYSYTKTSLFNVASLSEVQFSNDVVTNHGLSAGFGAGFTFRLFRNLFAMWNLSARYQRPIILIRHKELTMLGGFPLPVDVKSLPSYNSVGANSTLSLAYLMEDLSTTLSLGFRYQYLYNFGTDEQYIKLNKQSDHFYGVTVALVYAYQAPEKAEITEKAGKEEKTK
jgi:hypothetical protein